VPALALALAGVALGLRARSRIEPALAVAACVWLVADVVLVNRGYAPSPRFLLPPGALLTILAADGLLRALRGLRAPVAASAAIAAACAVAVVVANASTARAQFDHAAWFRSTARSLDAAVRRTGGPVAIGACGGAGTLEPFRTRLAWDIRAPTSAVRRGPHRVGIVFALRTVGTPAVWRPPRAAGARPRLGRVGPWVVLSARRALARAPCRSALEAAGFRGGRSGNA
jgi:hypothetical protein